METEYRRESAVSDVAAESGDTATEKTGLGPPGGSLAWQKTGAGAAAAAAGVAAAVTLATGSPLWQECGGGQ